MIRIYETTLFTKASLTNVLYIMMAGCLNPDNNRLESCGKAMNSVDICAYANITMQELSRAIKMLYSVNAILTIRAKGKEFYYVNPNYMREESRDIFSFEWLLELFEEETNQQDKNLVYFKRGKKSITINIGDNLPK
jgi:hypothetical protein